MGCDVIAPSDMMDGRVERLENISIGINISTFKFFHMQLSMHLIFMVLLEKPLDQKNL